jgi:hypothetical protein
MFILNDSAALNQDVLSCVEGRRNTADEAVAKAVFSSFRERFTKVAEFALAMSSQSQDKAELIQNLSLEELFRALPSISFV